MAVEERSRWLAAMTTDEAALALRTPLSAVVLLPVGAIEPHGPHLPLDTDLVISRAAAARAAEILAARGTRALIAPDVAYGVTECARDFMGAAGVPPRVFLAYLRAVVGAWLDNGARHVCVVNNHLEPAHDASVREAVADFGRSRASVASPLTRRWARTLSEEFKRGACHAGEYETSIVMAEAPERVREEVRRSLPEVDLSLSDRLREGVTRFAEMGMTRAYAGAPARASAAHGEEMLTRLAEMIVAEVSEATSGPR